MVALIIYYTGSKLHTLFAGGGGSEMTVPTSGGTKQFPYIKLKSLNIDRSSPKSSIINFLFVILKAHKEAFLFFLGGKKNQI